MYPFRYPYRLLSTITFLLPNYSAVCVYVLHKKQVNYVSGMQGYRTTVTLRMYQNTVNIIINGFRLPYTARAVPLVPCIKYLAATSIIKFFLLWDIIVSSFCYIATNQHQDCHVNLLSNRDQNHSSCIKNTNHSLSNLKKVVFNKKDLGSILESIIFRYKYCWL